MTLASTVVVWCLEQGSRGARRWEKKRAVRRRGTKTVHVAPLDVLRIVASFLQPDDWNPRGLRGQPAQATVFSQDAAELSKTRPLAALRSSLTRATHKATAAADDAEAGAAALSTVAALEVKLGKSKDAAQKLAAVLCEDR